MPDIGPILAHLDRSRTALLAALAHPALADDRWQQAPAPGQWSVTEVVAHLTMVESAITEGARKLIRAEPRRFPFWQRRPIPISLTAWRGIKRESPIPLDRSLLADRETMIARLQEARRQTLALLDENRTRDLRAWRWKHPFFGPISYYQWFRVMGYHEQRHTQQIQEIVNSFRK